MTDPRAILLDVEGTTTSIAFVADTLFPFARARLAAWVAANPGHPALADVPGDPLTTLTEWMDADAKVTPLKTIQGLIWREGYESGTLHGHVYPDTPAAFARWRDQGRTVAIYSSGSVEAQRLLFAHSVAGDLTPHLAHHFDTTTGPKRAPASYTAIAQALALPPPSILFVSDAAQEVDAARAAGLHALLIDRERGAGDVATLAEILP